MDPERRKRAIQRATTVLKWGGGLAGAAIISPVVFLAVKGIIGLTLAIVAGGTIIKLAPWAKMKMDNIAIKLLVHEAQINPIETLENLKIDKAQQLTEADQKIIQFETAVRTYDDRVKTFAKSLPEEADGYKEISQTMHAGLDARKQKQREARTMLAELDLSIQKAKMHYEMAQAALQVTELSKDDQSRIYAEIKEKVAFGAIQNKLNNAFASLNMAVEQTTTPALPAKEEKMIASLDPAEVVAIKGVVKTIPIKKW